MASARRVRRRAPGSQPSLRDQAEVISDAIQEAGYRTRISLAKPYRGAPSGPRIVVRRGMREAQLRVVPGGVVVEAENGLWKAVDVLKQTAIVDLWPVIGRLFDVHAVEAAQVINTPPRHRGDWRILQIASGGGPRVEPRSLEPDDVAEALRDAQLLPPKMRRVDVTDFSSLFLVVSDPNTFEPLFELLPVMDAWVD